MTYAIILLMAEHKVPQDVEADDKLLGPFSFRQFVYLMIAAAAGFLAFIMGSIAIPLALIPAPICIFFLIIALPLRKDQPTEIYLAALIKYYFKPRVRMWQADGERPLVEISNPIVDDSPKTKDIAGDEVARRLSFLANLSDTQGWSMRGVSAPINNTNLIDEFANDGVYSQDVMEDSELSNSIDHLLDKSERKVRQNAIDQMNLAAQRQQSPAATPTANPAPVTAQQATIFQPIAAQQSAPTATQQTNQTTPSTPSQPSVAMLPNLANTSNLPTYNYGGMSGGSPNLQLQAPQPLHNQQLQGVQFATAAGPVAATPTTQAINYQYQTPANNSAQLSTPVAQAQQPGQPQPTPSIQRAPTAPSQQPLYANSQAVQYAQGGQLAVPTPAKPAIISNDSVVPVSGTSSAVPTSTQSTIDIKLH